VGDGRAVLASRAAGSADAVLVDAFVGARVPRHLVTAEALADCARVVAPAGLVAVNIVGVPPHDEAAAVAAGLAAALPHVFALGAAGAVRRRRPGNVLLVGAHRCPPLDRLRARAAADPAPAVLLEPGDAARVLGGAVPFRDAGG
jgi:spermidine synthase